MSFFDFSLESNLALLFGAGALAAGGAAFVSRGLRVKAELAAARTRLVTGGSAAENAKGLSPTSTNNNEGLPRSYSQFDRETVRRLAWMRLSPARVLVVFPLVRIVAGACLALAAVLFAERFSIVVSHFALRLLAGAIGALSGWFVPVVVMRWMMSRRLKAVVAGLPDALELLVVCAEGGLSLEEGIQRVMVELKRPQPELAEELAQTAADLKILPNRDEALARLAERVDQQNFRSVVTTLTQTMRYGTPLAQALRTVAAEMRNDSLVRLEERANRLPALLTIPMMLFIMPTIFLIIGGPAILRLMSIFYR